MVILEWFSLGEQATQMHVGLISLTSHGHIQNVVIFTPLGAEEFKETVPNGFHIYAQVYLFVV